MAILRVGAWGGRAAVLDPAKTARQVIALGLTDLSLCVESQWNAGDGKTFDPFVSSAKLAAALGQIEVACAEAGKPIRTHVLMFPQACTEWVDGAVQYLRELAAAHRLYSVEDDAEENWSARTQAERIAAAKRYREQLEQLPFNRGVTGIVYADFAKLKPLFDGADYVTPQGYSTTVGKVAPGRAQRLAMDRWRPAARTTGQCVMGLAAYGQEGAGDMPAARAMQTAWDAAEQLGVTEVRYWSLAALTGTPGRFVAAKCAAIRGLKPAGGAA